MKSRPDDRFGYNLADECIYVGEFLYICNTNKRINKQNKQNKKQKHRIVTRTKYKKGICFVVY